MTDNRIENLILEAKHVIANKVEKRRKSGGDYNIFSVLGMERYEVDTHSNMIYSFLNPDSGHFMGKKYLNLFVEHVLGFDNPNKFSKEWHVEREWPFSDGRIDFVVFNDDHYIAIEMKIDANDQEAQLSRYEKYAKSENSNSFEVFYLTLDGKGASPQSAAGLEKDYRRISFKRHIIKWLNCCINDTPPSYKAYNALAQYKELIEKLVSDQNQKGVEEMSMVLLNSENYRAYLDLVRSEKAMKQTFMQKFLYALEERLKLVNHKFKNNSEAPSKEQAKIFINDSKSRLGFTLNLGKRLFMSNGKEYNLVFSIDIGEPEGNMALGFTLAEIREEQNAENITKIREVIITEGDYKTIDHALTIEKSNPTRVYESGWIYWDHFHSESKNLYNLRSFNNPVIDMLDEHKFELEMDRIIGTVNNHLGRVK